MTTDTRMSLWFERSGNPAWGLFGGQDGAPPKQSSTPEPPERSRRLKPNRMPLRKGDTVRCYTGGGGGYGNPLDRTHKPSAAGPERPRGMATPSTGPKAVQADLADGHITPDYARRHHLFNLEGIIKG